MGRRDWQETELSRSEQLSSAFYRQLGSKGLAARTTPAWDLQILEQVQAMLKPGQRVLDLGCGYGWTAFNELLDWDEQLAAVREAWRVLAPDGWALFEGPLYVAPTLGEIGSGQRYGRGYRITRGEISGVHVHVYRHDSTSLRSLMRSAGISSYRICTGRWAGRERLFLRLEKVRGAA